MLEADHHFLKHVSAELCKLGGRIILYKGKYIGDKKAFGEFSANENIPIIKISIAHEKEDCLGTLAHEYGHFTQWMSKCKVWKSIEDMSVDAHDMILHGKKDKIDEEYIDRIINLEYDADKRAIKIIKEINIELSIDDYCKKSNLIIVKWMFFKKYGVWPHTSLKKFKELTLGCSEKLSKLPQKDFARLEPTLLWILSQYKA